jgi:ribosomal protein S18 acetylase RimI-like enzyme
MKSSDVHQQITELVNRYSPIVRKVSLDDVVSSDYDVIVKDDQVVACIKAAKLSWYQVELTHLVVKPEYRRRGYGRALLRRACETAYTKARIVQATIRKDNRPSMALFETEGFRLVNNITGLSGTPVGIWQKVLSDHTYSAFYQEDHSAIVYRRRADDGTLDKLPQNAEPANDARSTYFRTDGGDRFEFALFRTRLGQLIVVQRDQVCPRE